jgi:phosphohistidine swiveling domain-containing protein
LGGILWRVDRELGRRLTAAGRLDEVDDIELLTGDEMVQLIHGHALAPELLALRRRRRTAAELEAPLPRFFRGRPSAPTPPPLEGGRFKGWGGSPGRYEGRARIVRRPEKSGLRRGEVLVAHTTDASWLPLFQIAGAVVVEQGGPLSHAAVLARELGMPAVVNIPGIVDRMAGVPGALVVVDGTTGEVGIHHPDQENHEGEPTDGVIPFRPEPIVRTDDTNRLHVFITGLIGTGALMSVVIGLAQAIGSARTQRRVSLQVRPRAEALAAATVHGFEPRAVGRAGIRPRGYYAWMAAVGAGLAVLLLWAGDDYIEEPSQAGSLWQLALALTSASTVAAFAAVNLVAAGRWPRVPWVARLATAPLVHQRLTPNQLIGPVHATLVGALLLTVLGLGWLVAEADRQLLIIDEWLFEAIGAGTEERWSPAVLDQALRREIMVPLAVVLTAATYRCRALLLTYPLVIAGGGALHLGLAHLLSRERPPEGPKPGVTDSFPGGHVNELTIMLGLLPLILFVLTRRRWVGAVAAVVCWPVLLVMVADAFRTGDHWPTDNLAGLFIGLSMVLIAHGVSRAPVLHGRCRQCPAIFAARAEPAPTDRR